MGVPGGRKTTAFEEEIDPGVAAVGKRPSATEVLSVVGHLRR